MYPNSGGTDRTRRLFPQHRGHQAVDPQPPQHTDLDGRLHPGTHGHHSGYRFDAFQADERDRVRHAGHCPAEPEQRRIGDAQQLRRKGRVRLDECGNFLGRYVFPARQKQQAIGYGREWRREAQRPGLVGFRGFRSHMLTPFSGLSLALRESFCRPGPAAMGPRSARKTVPDVEPQRRRGVLSGPIPLGHGHSLGGCERIMNRLLPVARIAFSSRLLTMAALQPRSPRPTAMAVSRRAARGLTTFR